MAAKFSSKFVCSNCGYESIGLMGRCPECGEFNTMREVSLQKESTQRTKNFAKPLTFDQVSKKENKRIASGIYELDRVLGEGFVPGSLILLAGEPGIGKSTLLLQMSLSLSSQNQLPVLYVCGEENPSQIKIRSERIAGKMTLPSKNFFLWQCNEVKEICEQIESLKPKVVLIDSIQTVGFRELNMPMGSLNQVKEAAVAFGEIAKKTDTTIFLVGHITKEGNIAGPKTLEHLVDAVFYFEGEKTSNLRILRSSKNRFGPTDEIGVFEMKDSGLLEVDNLSSTFLTQNKNNIGSTVTAVMEGKRVVLAEIQALVSQTNNPLPRRVVSGLDYNRCLLMIAVVQKYLNLPLYGYDIYITSVGGIKISEPAVDLGICISLVSSFQNRHLPVNMVVFGEVGLLGEIRKIGFEERRIKEARRQGFIQALSGANLQNVREIARILKP